MSTMNRQLKSTTSFTYTENGAICLNLPFRSNLIGIAVCGGFELITNFKLR